VQIEMQIEIQRVIHIVIGIDDVTWWWWLQEVAGEMVVVLEESPSFSSWEGRWVENPLPIGTEQEIACMNRHEPIYRAVFTRQ